MTGGRYLCAALPAVFLLGCSGSGFDIAPVSGTVTLNGRPVTQGMVIFTPEAGPQAAGQLGPGGRYTLTTLKPDDGAIVGEHSVAIEAPTYGAPMGNYKPPPPPPPEETIPPQYHHPTTSGLTRTVERGRNSFDFELK